jgi:DNA-binding CsgD family transcriptional regulator
MELMAATAQTRRRRQALIEAAWRQATAADVFAATSARLRGIVAFDGAAWLATDPGTGLPTSPVRIENLEGVSQAMCSTHWQHELLHDDVNQFRDLARAEVPAATFLDAVDDPVRSGRYRRFLRPLGMVDELRTVLRVGDTPWGTVTLWRRDHSPPFSSADAALLAGLSAPLGEVLRHHARPTSVPPPAVELDRPGLLLFDGDGEVVAADESAVAWLDELPHEPGVESAYGILPVWLLVTMFRASAVRHGAGDGTARTRVRARDGRWLVCHASCMRQASGEYETTALVLEPAQPATIAPIIVEAFDLTEREEQIVRLIARGYSTSELAEELHLSRHTVRDHIKAVFAKAGVSSRGELTAKLFADVYEPTHAAELTRVRVGA